MRLPTFSRQTDTADAERPTATGATTQTDRTTTGSTTPIRPRRDEDVPTVPTPVVKTSERDLPPPPPSRTHRTEAERAADVTATDRAATDRAATDRAAAHRATPDRVKTDRIESDKVAAERAPVVTGPKPRASLLATLGLILGVASALLVLSGPLLGYGIGVAALALVLSLAGIHATGKRHVAGKSDALIGMVLALGAIVVGVLALTGSLSWLGTDMQPVGSLRHWLDAQFVNRF